jgi:hypothetical protein
MGGIEQSKVGRCWNCGYLLLGLGEEARRCPECGRKFDPADRSTMNFGREMGRMGRFMLKPVAWPLVMTGVVACAMVLAVSRWPVGGPGRWFVDLPNYFRPVSWPGWRERLREVGWEGAVYVAGVGIWAFVLAAWWGGTALRWVAIWRYRPPAFQRGREVRQQWVLWAIFVLTMLGVGAGWPYRLGRLWVAKERDLDMKGITGPARQAAGSIYVGVWSRAGTEPAIALMRTAARHGKTAADRLYAVKIMVEGHAPQSLPWLVQAEAGEKELANRAVLLRLIGMYRKDGPAGDVLERRLDDPIREIRLAAADGLGFLHGVAYPTYTGWNRDVVRISSDPPIDVGRLIEPVRYWGASQGTFEEWADKRRIEMPEARREKLMRMMLGEVSLDEREAAARAILACPQKGYRLRVAEWGVWATRGPYIAAARQKGAIPAFVHEAGDSAASIAATRLQRSMEVLKPVIHVTADVPMAVDVDVRMRWGRPWFVYPMPDDYSLATREAGLGRRREDDEILVGLDSKGMRALGPKPLRQGYPWLTPASPPLPGDFISELGFRWQSLVLSPSKLSWMKEPPAQTTGPAGWWANLRDVESSWVSNRGESERFLFYDGPTMMKLPVEVRRAPGGLRVKGNNDPGAVLLPTWGQPTAVAPSRDGLLVEVRGRGAVVRGRRVRVPMSVLGERDADSFDVWSADEVAAQFEQELMRRGLLKSEAKGMMSCWRKEWFETDGERLLLFLEGKDYDLFCPMTIRPPPTELVRVGVVWVEF